MVFEHGIWRTLGTLGRVQETRIVRRIQQAPLIVKVNYIRLFAHFSVTSAGCTRVSHDSLVSSCLIYTCDLFSSMLSNLLRTAHPPVPELRTVHVEHPVRRIVNASSSIAGCGRVAVIDLTQIPYSQLLKVNCFICLVSIRFGILLKHKKFFPRNTSRTDFESYRFSSVLNLSGSGF